MFKADILNMKLLGSTLSWLLHVLIRRWFLLFTLFALYYYHVVLNKDMLCTCYGVGGVCLVYLMVPALLLFAVQLWVDLAFSRGLRLLCHGVRAQVAPVLIWRVLEAVFVGLLWVQAVLLDGDWYFCCGPYNLYCFAPDEDQLRNRRNESMVIGLLLAVAMTLTAAILSWIPFGKCCTTDWPEAALAETGLMISQQMRVVARNELRAKLDQSEANQTRKWEGLEKDLLLDPNPAEILRVQDTVHVNPLPLSPFPRQGTDIDLSRLEQDQDRATSNGGMKPNQE